MKRMVCEMCGGTDLIKQDGVFVCQSCGTKYSVEDAKKMMVEIDGTVEVTGTVKVDTTESVKNYLNLAWEAYNSQNYVDCERYAKMVLETDDKNYEAWFLRGSAAAWQSKLGSLRVTESVSHWEKALQYVPQEKLASMGRLVADSLDNVTFAVQSLHMKYMACANKQTHKDMNDRYSKFMRVYGEANSTYMSIYNLRKGENNPFYEQKATFMPYKFWDVAMSNLEKETLEYCRQSANVKKLLPLATDGVVECLSIDHLITGMVQSADVAAAYDRTLQTARRVMDFLKKAGFAQAAKASFDEIQNIEQRKKLAVKEAEEKERKKKEEAEIKRQEKIHKYWESHQEEKAALDAKRVALVAEKEPYDKQHAADEERVAAVSAKSQEKTPAETEIEKLHASIEVLEYEISILGIFKGKEKKQLQEQVDAKKQSLKEMEALASKERKELKEDIKKQIATIREETKENTQKLAELNGEIAKIDAELTRDR